MIKNILDFYPALEIIRGVIKNSRHRVFLVGGAIRNYYLKTPGTTDFDFAVDGDAIALARQIARRIKGAFVLLDESHGSARIVKKQGDMIWIFDLTDWRGKTIARDLSLRDFTINTFAVELTNPSAKILSAKGAEEDLKKKKIRMVSTAVFKDDPLRLLRAFSLHAALGFQIEKQTLAQIKKDAHLIGKVASERIREEIFKVLSSPRAFETLCDMDQIGLLPQVMPQITVMYGIKQGGYHHLDVWKHSLLVVANIEKMSAEFPDEKIKQYLQAPIGGAHSRLSLLKMAGLLHDIGKPETRKKEGKRMTFHGHEHTGERITRQVARQLKLSAKERYFLEDAVRMHLRPGYLSNFKRPSEKAIFRYLRDAKQEAVSLAILALADQAATLGVLTTQAKHKHHAKICHMLIERYFEKAEEKPKARLLTGHDLIKVLKLKPSVLFGKILAQVEEAAALGKITTRKEAITLARNLVNTRC